ncbi:hypothetical protein [Botrimarina sp.]|uniref:hypothetical protein n=1 Tax=Botrimarina sp. TaxID=2795802 RepID=UPI0032EDA7D9
MKFERISYGELNARQKETYNFHKIAGVLADYGFTSIRLSDDWQGADFIAVHIDGKTTLRVQLKGRLSFNKKYSGKGVFIAFPYQNSWYLYPHDTLQQTVFGAKSYGASDSWTVNGGYSVGKLGTELLTLLRPYRLPTE